MGVGLTSYRGGEMGVGLNTNGVGLPSSQAVTVGKVQKVTKMAGELEKVSPTTPTYTCTCSHEQGHS